MTEHAAQTCRIGPVVIGAGEPVLIAGPCMAESEQLCLDVAGTLAELCREQQVGYVFKASFDKANRSSIGSYRGPGLHEAMGWFTQVRDEVGCPALTDVHEPHQCIPAAEAVDCLQIPAFLCRQTDLLIAAAETGKCVNVKKGQFMAPWDMRGPAGKLQSAGCENILLTERGTSFGYNRLITDFRGLKIMQQIAPVCFDATHSIQEPAGQGETSGGQREFALPLAMAAMAVGADALFVETHPNPEAARSDAACQVPLAEMGEFLGRCLDVFRAVRQ